MVQNGIKCCKILLRQFLLKPSYFKNINFLIMHRILRKNLFFNAQNNKASAHKIQLKKQYSKIFNICKPELKKYLFNASITLVHAAVFMYLPNIYTDINFLMSLKVSQVPAQEIYQFYAMTMGKWAAIFSALGLITYKRRFEFLDISNRISVRMRNILYKQILDKDFYKNNQIPQTFVHHLITDIKTVSEFTGESVFMGVRGLFFLLGGISCLVYTSPYICVIAISIMSLFNLLFRGRNQILKQLKEEENSVLASMSQFSAERFHNIKLIKISNTELLQQYKFLSELTRFYDYSKKVAKANGFNYGSLQGLGLFSLFSVAAAGSFLISMQITSFSLIASSTYALYVAMGFRSVIFFNTELMKIMGVYANIQNKIGDLTKQQEYFTQPFILDRMIEEEQKLKKLFVAKYGSEKNSNGVSITIKGLNFSHFYQDNHHQVKTHLYKNFDLQISSGEIVGLVGDSGTGKSTLFNLVTKLVQPISGQISINNKPIDQFTFQDIQHMVSYITQQVFLFAGTIQQNLKYGNHGFDLSEQNLINCLQMANALEFVQRKGGLKGRVQQKGNNLSGGQRQRIILARALLKNPSLLLLDEATSGIDSVSQGIIIDSLKTLSLENRTTIIIISHKLQPFKRIINRTIHLAKEY